ncbi:MAG: protein-tyrosine-phosphatase [Balneolales bacterium]|nr:protein-tyrosine-phosphatase [Balneolales bacterium]
MKTNLYPALAGTIGYVLDNIAAPDESRKQLLQNISEYIKNNPLHRNLTFVCTHNSRRSHLAQYWAAAAAAYYDVEDVHVFSGGTEATALHPNTLDALLESSFEVKLKQDDETNPVYEILLGGHIPAILGFSKKIDTSPNPDKDFCAVMVCTEADEGCPFVPGAKERVSLPYVDPKVSDGTPERRKVYHERSLQIAREMLWVFEQASE